MTVEQDNRFMTRAIRLAEHGMMTTDPNPRVGCVLVRNGEIVGEGWHQRAGEPHAEINALQMAGERARGATAYVTLEPCCHHGRTPPCTQALINAGIKRVVVAMRDPNPEVAGKGLAELEANGIEVSEGLLHGHAEALNPGFIKRMTEGRPYIRVKLAMSMDGRTAMASGESKWITSEEARRDVHHLRARSSAILTGMGTVRADDPNLTVRLDEGDIGDYCSPLRVVLDTRLSISSDAKLLLDDAETLVITSTEARGTREDLQNVDIESVHEEAGRLDLHEVMKLLAARDINEVMVESGSTLSGALLRARLVDELVIYMAPHFMGDNAKGLLHLPGLEKMDQRIMLRIKNIHQVGNDVRITAEPEQV